jgi:ubiquitin-conjugating enzyme E2 O
MDQKRELQTDDVVALATDNSILGVVEKTHGDVDTHEPYPQRQEPEKIHHDRGISKIVFNQFMRDGIPPKDTVFVRWQHSTHPSLIPVSNLILLDRSLIMGDVVKKRPQDAMSGVVLNTFTKCTLQPVSDLSLIQNSRPVLSLKGLLPPSDNLDDNIQQSKPPPLVDIPAFELKYAEPITEDELVIYKDWIGRVDSVTTALTLKLSDNCVVEVPDHQVEHVDGAFEVFFVGDIASTKKGVLRNGKWIYGQYNPNTMPVGTVVQIRNVTVDVHWLQRRIGSAESTQEPPESLEREQIESAHFHVYDRTAKPKMSSNIQSTVSNSEVDVRLGLRVRFKDLSGACVKYDGSSRHGKLNAIARRDTLGYDLNVFDIIKFHTEVSVQWQDLSVTTERSIDLVPDLGIDDVHAAWPGEIAHTLNFLTSTNLPGITWPERVGVVQDVNAAERMATLRWCPGASLHYSEDEQHPEIKMLLTGVVGFPGTEQEEMSLYDIEAPGAMNVRRGDCALISNPRWKEEGLATEVDQGVDWFGEIVDTSLDGTLTVRLGAAKEVRDVVLRREDLIVAVRSDGTDEIDGWGNNDFDMGISSDKESSTVSSEEDYEDNSPEEEEMDVKYEDENGIPLDQEDVEDGSWESDEEEDTEADGDVDMIDAPPESQTPPTSHSVTPPIDPSKEPTAQPHPQPSTASPSTDQYLILDTPAPSSHIFSPEPPASNPTLLKRIHKEHKILRSANTLPTGVYVRTWESRLDLLRVLFIGPAETPYAHAPFVIDFHMGPTFPTQPPSAHFHSWSLDNGLGGVGRVNPNLYEDGKICLSLLGTWEGNKGEGWNASRSTLLQVLVSILGLVLVREPYFNEAGYEPLAGMESAKRPSALYSERAYLRSLTFVIKALMWVASEQGGSGTPVEGLVEVLKKVYKEDVLLRRVVGDLEGVIERSESGLEEADGLRVVSKGACIPLKRIREQLLTL